METGMGTLTFTCPQTRKTIRTGIETDRYALLGAQFLSMRVNCPHCGEAHELQIKDAHIARAA